MNVRASGFSLEISAEQNSSPQDRKSGIYVQRERSHGSYHRSVQFPQEVTLSGARAVLKNEILEVEVPKVTKSLDKARKVSIK